MIFKGVIKKMEKRDGISISNKGLFVPITLILLWLGIWIYGYMLAWKINNLVHLMLGTVLFIIMAWTYFSVKLKCKNLIRGLNLFSLATFMLILDELNMPPVSNYTSTELAGVVMIVSFVIMTLGIKQQVSDNNSLLETLVYNANRDELTNLPNRRAISKRVEDLIEAANREGTQLAIFWLDFDNIKRINDTYGHEFGDQVLVNMAQQMNAMFSNDFFFGRFGSDEFLVVQKNVKTEETIHNTAKKIIQRFDEIKVVDGCHLHMSTSIGISIYPKDGTSKTELLRKADWALHKVKNTNKNDYELYTSTIEMSNDSHDLKVDISVEAKK
jgi:diguanylate cyclase (GGDEF)-like protein